MFWSKKEDKSKLPDLPPINIHGNIPSQKMDFPYEDEDYEKHRLPSFPDSPMQRGFSQTIIKDAVNNEDAKEETIPFQDAQRKFKTIEMEDTSRVFEPKLSPPPEQYTRPQKYEATLPKSKNSDIYVKIDKFNSAKRSLSAIHEKLGEIDELLKRIRETKLKEDQELSNWEREISSLRSKMQEVTESIFEKAE